MLQGAKRVPPGDPAHRHTARPAADIFRDACCFCDWHLLRIRSERVLRVETRTQDSSLVCVCVQPPPRPMINAFSRWLYRRRFLVRAAFFAAAERDRVDRRRAAERACLESALWDAAERPSRFNAPWSRGTVCVKVFYFRRGGPLPNRAWLDVLFVSCLASAAVASHRPVVLLTNQWRSPVAANAPHVSPPEYAPFLRARIHLPAWKGKALYVRPRARVQQFLLLA